MLNIVALLLIPSAALAGSPSLSKATTKGSTPTLSIATTAADSAWTWYVGVEDAPFDEVYSHAEVYGYGDPEVDSMESPLTRGSAGASSSVEDEGDTDDISWQKSAEASHSSSWQMLDKKRRGIKWSYSGSGSHEVQAQLDAPDCVVEDGEIPDLGCMLEVTSIGMSGIQSTPDAPGGPGSAGGLGGAGGSDGSSGSDDADLDDTTFLVVEETTRFLIVASFDASVGVDVEGQGMGDHSSAFSVNVRDRATGLVELDWAAQPVTFSWSFSAGEDDRLQDSANASFTLEPGEYELQMNISDATSSYTWSTPGLADGRVVVDSAVTASVQLSSY